MVQRVGGLDWSNMLLQRATKRAVKLTRDAKFMMNRARWHAELFGLHPNTTWFYHAI
jgi:hypothetical protein